jgi:hypothetical protein
MWLAAPRSSVAPHFDGQRCSGAGGTQLCAAAPKDHTAASAANANLIFIVPPEILSFGHAYGGRYRRA